MESHIFSKEEKKEIEKTMNGKDLAEVPMQD